MSEKPQNYYLYNNFLQLLMKLEIVKYVSIFHLLKYQFYTTFICVSMRAFACPDKTKKIKIVIFSN